MSAYHYRYEDLKGRLSPVYNGPGLSYVMERVKASYFPTDEWTWNAKRNADIRPVYYNMDLIGIVWRWTVGERDDFLLTMEMEENTVLE